MDNRILISPRVISRPGNTAPVSSSHVARQPGGPGFQQILDQKTQVVKFSAHALERLSRRNIP
ncbi:MAG: flagellar biosynthesis protein, partial [Heliobacteriaceae bacterium]|nr:flagellar biosynthesis protein [Heliobacteriaceae bacterium]